MRPWLFSRNVDLAAFGGTAAVALLAAFSFRFEETPPWIWIAVVLFVDVSHVHATLFRTYLDSAELRRRPVLYTVAPIACFFVAIALYRSGALVFWRCAAYLAVFHFVRQQYGWVALYRSRGGERDRFGWLIDSVAVYASTLYPLLWWHTHLPRSFWWFLPNDFAVQLSPFVSDVAFPIYCVALAAYAARSIARGIPNPGKDLVVVTTALCWYTGIVALNSDFAFTVTNVLIHGVPYIVLIYFYEKEHGSPFSVLRSSLSEERRTKNEERRILTRRARSVAGAAARGAAADALRPRRIYLAPRQRETALRYFDGGGGGGGVAPSSGKSVSGRHAAAPGRQSCAVGDTCPL